ncbi:MAG: hypothetical protein ABEL51_00990 [Salinibacter sp.]
MTADARAHRYYYIFDSRKRRALVLDRTTGEERVSDVDPRVGLIRHVQSDGSAGDLREFARWCARQVGADAAPSHTAAGRLWAAAQRDDLTAWKRVRRETSDTVMLAVALGLPQYEPEAARLLTLQSASHPDPEQAALDAAHMSERWAEFDAEGEPAAAAKVMRARHIDWLLDRMPES